MRKNRRPRRIQKIPPPEGYAIGNPEKAQIGSPWLGEASTVLGFPSLPDTNAEKVPRPPCIQPP